MTRKKNESEKKTRKVEINEPEEDDRELEDLTEEQGPDQDAGQAAEEEVKDEGDDEVIEAEIVDDEEDEDEPSEDKAQEKKDEGAEDRARLIRLQADFANFKKRAEKDRQDTIKFANEKLILKLVDVVDNFDRAMAQDQTEKDSFFEGMSLIFDQLTGVLKEEGLEALDPAGQAFDPNFHDAVLSEASEAVPSGHVIETLQKGYLLKGRLIRPAMVKVAQ